MGNTRENQSVWEHNGQTWDAEARAQGPWSQPVTPEVISRARLQDWELRLAGDMLVPRSWFPISLKGVPTLVLG